MLAVPPLGNNTTNNHDHQYQRQEQEMEAFANDLVQDNDFHDFCSNGNSLMDGIDFDDLFLGIHEGDVLPDLEMDPELLAEFSINSNESDTLNTSIDLKLFTGDGSDQWGYSRKERDNNSDQSSPLNSRGEEVVSKMDDSVVVNPTRREADNVVKEKKWIRQSKMNHAHGKRKVKVDWTPELHRRFVQAVEQLGVDKAVPSRILELMGIDCLTRHNIASHLQKYRSHRKHLLAREAEAASWSQRRQMYGAVPVATAAVGGGGGGGGSKRDVNPWIAPATLVFPPVTPAPPMPSHFRPLHVWGHPTTDQSMWPKHHHSPSTPPPTWPPAVPPYPHLPPESPYWRHPHQRVPTAGTSCFPPLFLPPPTRFGAPLVPGIPSHAMYKVKPSHPTGRTHPLELHPSKESIDAAIGDVLSKPWLPLPLGLKPPSVDGVVGELQRQGVAIRRC